MAKQIINIGSGFNTKDGDTVRDAFNKVNQNFTELYNTVQSSEETQNIDGGSASTVFDDEDQ
jgi:chromosome segregation ATPase